MKFKQLYLFLSFLIFILRGADAWALTPGAILYRTSSNGIMYGYSSNYLLDINYGILSHIYPGHVGIYIGKENGEDYVVEALATGIVKTPAKYFVNESLGEKFLGAKIPYALTTAQQIKVVKIAKNLANLNLAYDFNFQKQKGAGDGDWTCVGLIEKIYESANILNPNNLSDLEYDQSRYAIDITPDGFDNSSFVNADGDCFSKTREFSMISRRKDLVLPFPEKVGFNAGREYKGERYFFIPYTQYLQPTLKDVPVNVEISSSFEDKKIRGKTPIISLMLRWSLVNNPMSSIKNTISIISTNAKKVVNKIFKKNSTDLVFNEQKIDENDYYSDIEDEKNNDVVLELKSNEIVDDKNSKISAKSIISEEIDEKKEKEQKNKNDDTLVKAIKNSDNLEDKEPEKQVQTKVDLLQKITVKKQEIETNNEIKDNVSSVVIQNSKIGSGQEPESVNIENVSNDSVLSFTPTALISKVYATGMNDFIELYNPTNYDFDLAEAGFRIEKTKTAENPSIAVRIGKEEDAIYPGGTKIKARGYYLLVRDDASNYFLSRADAIVKRNEFGFTGNGYTLYLGKGAISSSADEDIIDVLGFGNAHFYLGEEPAPEIFDNYYLDRISSSNNNKIDFKLFPSADPSIVWDDYIIDTETEEEAESEIETGEGVEEEPPLANEEGTEENTEVEEETEENSNFSPFLFPEPIINSDLILLNHYDECYGENSYTIGKFDCAAEFGFRHSKYEKNLETPLDLNNLTLSFYFKDNTYLSNASPKLNIVFKNPENQFVSIELQKKLLQIENLPNSKWRYYNTPVFTGEDYSWQHFALVINEAQNYWAVYFNGVETYREEFIQNLPNNYSTLEIWGDMDSMAIDEFALFSVPLTNADINNQIQAQAPFAPYNERPTQKAPELKYYWDFNEGTELINSGGGKEAVDEINGLVLDIGDNEWIWRGEDNTGIKNRWEKDIVVNFPESIQGKDLSLAFWWRNSDDDGRSLISLRYNNHDKFSFAPAPYRRSFYFNGIYGIFSEGLDVDLPNDDNWHYFTFTYDSYRYILKMYVDGQQKRSLPFIWIKDGEEPNNLNIRSELNKVELDDISIWEGTLSDLQIANLYQSTLAQ